MTLEKFLKEIENLTNEYEYSNGNTVVGVYITTETHTYEWNGESMEQWEEGYTLGKREE